MNRYLSSFKLLVIMLLILLELSTVIVVAAPITPEINWWTVVVKPITWSPNTVHQERITTQQEPFQKWWNSISPGYPSRSKLAWTMANSYPSFYSTCRELSCHGKDFSKNHDGKNCHDQKQCDKNWHEKNKRGQNHHDRHCGKDQHWKHCNTNQCDKLFDRDRHAKHCAKNRNGKGGHGMNFCAQNKQRKMINGNKHKEFIVDNKVIVNINNDQTIQMPSPTLLHVDTTVPVLVSTTHGSVKQSSSFCSLWFVDICLLIYCICFLIALCLIRV